MLYVKELGDKKSKLLTKMLSSNTAYNSFNFPKEGYAHKWLLELGFIYIAYPKGCEGYITKDIWHFTAKFRELEDAMSTRLEAELQLLGIVK
jgi:hypothetical protein